MTIRPTSFLNVIPPKDAEKAVRFAESIRDNTKLDPEVRTALNKQPGFISTLLDRSKKNQPNFVSSISQDQETAAITQQQNHTASFNVSPDWKTRTAVPQKSNERTTAAL